MRERDAADSVETVHVRGVTCHHRRVDTPPSYGPRHLSEVRARWVRTRAERTAFRRELATVRTLVGLAVTMGFAALASAVVNEWVALVVFVLAANVQFRDIEKRAAERLRREHA